MNYYQNQYLRPQMNAVQPQFGLKGRPVASLEEARAAGIDFDGSIFYFPDMANKRIYTKQINMDGTASLLMYELKEIPIEKSETTDYITRTEFEKVILEIKNNLEKMVAAVPPQEAVNLATTPVKSSAEPLNLNF